MGVEQERVHKLDVNGGVLETTYARIVIRRLVERGAFSCIWRLVVQEKKTRVHPAPLHEVA
jgi:hypothetical protein